MKSLPLALALIAAVALSACGGSDQRYVDFSADLALLTAADLPAGWEFLPADELPGLEPFFPPDATLEDAAVAVASNGALAPDLQMAAVGVALVSGDVPSIEERSIFGLGFKVADLRVEPDQVTFISFSETDFPTKKSVRLEYFGMVRGEPLTTDAVNFAEGRIIVDVEIVHPQGLIPDPDLDLETLVKAVHQRITAQLR